MNVVGALFLALIGVHLAVTLLVYHRQPIGPEDRRTEASIALPLAPFFVILHVLTRKRKPALHPGLILQTTLFLLACYFGHQAGVFSRGLVSPISIAVGLAAGHMIFGVSLLATHRSLRDAASHFFDLGALWEFVVENPRVLMQFITVSVAEELIYRVGMQPLLIQGLHSAFWGIVATAVVFSLVHEHFFRNATSQSAEFVGFALLLGVLYHFTGSLILVIAVHAIRNIEIAFLDNVLRADELGNEDQASRETQYLNGERVLAFVMVPGQTAPVWCFESSEEPGMDAVRETASSTKPASPQSHMEAL